MKELPFVVNDRRGQKKEPRPEPVAVEPQETKDNTAWKSIAYLTVLLPTPNGPMPSCRCVGLRSDDLMCAVDWLMPPWTTVEVNFYAEVRKRADTFLGCDCISRHMCGTHNEYLQMWMRADMDRLNGLAATPLPEVLELFMRAEMARKNSAIVAPGR